jgi:hypothetical protein
LHAAGRSDPPMSAPNPPGCRRSSRLPSIRYSVQGAPGGRPGVEAAAGQGGIPREGKQNAHAFPAGDGPASSIEKIASGPDDRQGWGLTSGAGLTRAGQRTPRAEGRTHQFQRPDRGVRSRVPRLARRSTGTVRAGAPRRLRKGHYRSCQALQAPCSSRRPRADERDMASETGPDAAGRTAGRSPW